MTFGLDRIGSLFSQDVVAIINVSNEQIFADAIPVKASINQYSEQFKHPLEDSSVITDHRVIMPIEIDLILTIPNGEYKDLYGQIKKAHVDGDILQVRTKAATFNNMLIKAMPHEETPKKFDAIDVVLKLEETQFESVLIETLSFNQVENKAQSSNVDRGQQNPDDPSSSLLSQIADQGLEIFRGFLP